MSPKVKVKAEDPEILVFSEEYDEEVEQNRKAAIEYAAKRGGAHLYLNYDDRMVVSTRPLSPSAVQKALYESAVEEARFCMQQGDNPVEVLQISAVSGADIGRIAREEGIKLPPFCRPFKYECECKCHADEAQPAQPVPVAKVPLTVN